VLVRALVPLIDPLKPQPWQLAKARSEPSRDSSAARRILLEQLETLKTKKSVELGHPGIEAGEVASVVAGIAVLPSYPNRFGDIITIRRDQAAFTGNDQL